MDATESVKSFKDYQQYIRTLTADVSRLHGLRFCVWCGERFKAAFGEIVWDGLNEVEHQQLEEIVLELGAAARTGAGMSPERAAQLTLVMNAFGPNQDDEPVDLEMHACAFFDMIYASLEWSRRGNSEALCDVSEQWINSWDYEQDQDGYNLETMFTFPDLRRELELQRAFLKR